MRQPPCLKAVVWDIDGTLVDSEPAHHAALLAACRESGVPIDDLDPATFVGVHVADVWEALRPRLGHAVDQDTWLGRICASYRGNMERVREQPGAGAVLRRLARAGVPQACVSNSGRPVVDANLDLLGAAALLRFSISLDDVRDGKPHPEGYLRACERLALEPCEVAAVEDSPTGLVSARAAGLFAVAYWPGAAGEPPESLLALCDTLIRDLRSMARLLGMSPDEPARAGPQRHDHPKR